MEAEALHGLCPVGLARLHADLQQLRDLLDDATQLLLALTTGTQLIHLPWARSLSAVCSRTTITDRTMISLIFIAPLLRTPN